MYEEYNFHLTQLRGVKAVMDDFAAFRPDEKTPVQVGTMITAAEAALGDAQVAEGALNLARGERDEKVATGHDTVVDVYAVMKRRFRKDPGSLAAIQKLPTDDGKPSDTLGRLQSTSKLWGILPNPPGSATAFKAWDTMGKTEFDAILDELKTALDTARDKEEEWDKVNGLLKVKDEEMVDFVTTALVQGRSQFAEGTPERAAIDGIPTEGSTPLPGEAQLIPEGASGPLSVAMLLSAEHATAFDVYEKAPGASDFVKVGADVPPGLYERTGLTPGDYEYKAVGKNSRGSGPESNIVSLTVA